MKNINTKELLFLIFTLIFSASLVAVSFSYPADSSDFPRFLSSAMLCISLTMIVNTLKSGLIKSDESGNVRDAIRRLKIPFSVFIGIAFYIASLKWFGFYLSTPLFMSGGMLMAGSRRFGLIAITTTAFLVVVFLLFSYSLGLKLPGGVIFK
ncbi:MAG: tripartite tricarboxylate transporter TctB family protein [Clostridiales bacterium]|nr:tripartite tricarboxylate transporter TctB family protein [Clostridiales bacterium]